MKRILMAMILAAMLFQLNAAGYSAAQENLRTAIESSLMDSGYIVERQDDGLKFNNNGNVYYIEISKEDSDPMYVRLTRYIRFDDKIKRDDVIGRLTEYNSWYGVKTYCKEKNLILTADMFITSPGQFTGVCNKLLSLMKDVAEEISE